MSVTAQSRARVEMRRVQRTGMLMILLSLCSAFFLAHLAVDRFEHILMPKILAKSLVVAGAVRDEVDRAIELGIPFESLAGVDDFLDDTLSENPEIAYITIGHQGRLGYHRAREEFAPDDVIRQNLAASGTPTNVKIGVRTAYLNEKMTVMFGDAAVALLIALIVGTEIGLYFIFRWLLRPANPAHKADNAEDGGAAPGALVMLLALSNLGQAGLRGSADGALAQWCRPAARDVRMALFLFVLSEEMLRSFFPLYVKDFVSDGTRMGMELAITAPMVAYMLFAGLGTAFGGGFLERIGLRRAFGLSAAAGVVSLCGLALAGSLAEVIVWRALAALGYALATIACQSYIARSSGPTRAGLSTFVAAITAACVCGAPIGAVLADLFGHTAALLSAAACALLAWLIFRTVPMPAVDPLHEPVNARVHIRALLSRWRIVVLLGCVVLPAKMLLAGLLFYITPLLLTEYGLSQGSIGQYFIMFYVLLLGGNAFSDRLCGDMRRHARLVATGALMSGMGALLLPWFDTPLALALAILCFGFAQSLSTTPATALLLQLVHAEAPQIPATMVVVMQRTVERLGGVCGALLAALFSGWSGYAEAAAGLGLLAIVIALGSLSLLRPHSTWEGKSC
jgi:predicted MFS family arabinose efflux permease